MNAKLIGSYSNSFRLFVIIVCMCLISSCGGGNSSSNDSASETGALSFHVVYHGAAGNSQLQAAVIDCAGEGVVTVEAAVYDQDDALLRSGGPWDCEIGQGTISSVPAGSGRTVVILGKDGDGDVVFRGEKSDIQVDADSENDAGTIDCYAFAPILQAPTDRAVVNANAMGLAWNAVTGATEYHFLVSENSDLSDPIIDETTTTEIYTPAGLSNDHTYYWQVVAVDTYGNTGIKSQIWSFTVDAQHQNTPPVAQITSPAPGSQFTTDESIIFTGTGNDNEDGDLNGRFLVWRSDMDGLIGTGGKFDSSALSEGSHQITLTAIDAEGAIGTASVTITVSALGPGQCLGHEDPDTDCTTCLPGWTDVDGDHCSTLVRYVDIDNQGTAGLDGLTWSTAISAVQDGIDTCQTALQENTDESHCEVWVAEGTYYIYQTALHNSVQLRTGVHIFGGFSGTETNRGQRNWTEHTTTLDGHKNEGSTERVEHVVICEQEGLIDGFVITGGYNRCDDVYMGGGGMYISANSRPVVRNTIFQNNRVDCNFGGGIYLGENSTSILKNCTFDNNEAEVGGGLHATRGANLRAESCVFQNNMGWSGAGAVFNEGAQTVFILCRFISNNIGGDNGGAIESQPHTAYETGDDGSTITTVVNPVLEIDGCFLKANNYDNISSNTTGVVSLRQTQTTIRNSGFVNNTIIGSGAAVSSRGTEGTLDISNSYFYGNAASTEANNNTIQGGAVYCVDNKQVTLTNCTIVKNEVKSPNPENTYGGGIYSENCPLTITNCIIRDNIPEQVTSSNPSAKVTYSNVTGISNSPVQNHNIDHEVYFVGGADLHLLAHDPDDETVRNPCIDAANGDAAPATDFEGNPRVDDPQTTNTGSGTPGYVDMGAFEYQP